MQPAYEEESITEMKIIQETGVCLSELAKNGSRLKPIAFGSCCCQPNERNFHFFRGKAHVTFEQLVNIQTFYDVATSSGCTTTLLSKKSSNTMVI